MMITYDHLWWIKSTYDGWRRLKMLFWAIRVSIPTKNYEKKTVCVFFQGASDGNAPGRRNISQQSKNNEKLNFQKIDFLKIWNIVRIDARCIFWMFPPPEHHQKYPKNPIYTHFSKIMIFMIFINLYRNGPGAPNPMFCYGLGPLGPM